MKTRKIMKKFETQIMNVKSILNQIKQLERVIKSIDHIIGSDELEDIQCYIDSIKSELKK